jgi:hypothetical protein
LEQNKASMDERIAKLKVARAQRLADAASATAEPAPAEPAAARRNRAS